MKMFTYPPSHALHFSIDSGLGIADMQLGIKILIRFMD